MPPSEPAFLFKSTLSLQPLADFWQQLAADVEAPQTELARHVADRLAQAPDLLAPDPTAEVLAAHADLLALGMTAVLPPAFAQDVALSTSPPFTMASFFATAAYERLVHLEDACYTCKLNIEEEALALWKTAKAYNLILRQFYGATAAFDVPVIFTATDPETGLEQHHRIEVDPRFCGITLHGTLPALSEEQLRRLQGDPLQLEAWTAALPPDLFEFQGFMLIQAIDVTEHEVLSTLKHDLLQPQAMATPTRVAHLQQRLRSLLHLPDLELGLVAFEHDDHEAIRGARPLGRSLLLSDGTLPTCPHAEASLYARAYALPDETLTVSDLCDLQAPTGLERHLIGQGYRSMLLAPLQVKDRTVGLLELAAPRPGVLNALTALTLKQTIMLFATALKRSLDAQEDRVQAVIKAQYTAIHPLVEWRFRRAARAFMQQQAEGSKPRLEPIVFPDVYPLYGLTDIRDSSGLRAEAIREDLVEQLGHALTVVVEAAAAHPLPILDELAHRIHHCIDEITAGHHTEDEVSVLEFLREDVEGLFDHLAGFGAPVRARIEAYRAALDDALGIVYQRRKAFEQSIGLVNDTVAAYLEKQDQHAQRMFPHYFEQYKSDGVDYNIYIGASLLERGGFDHLYLRNLRLWQLMVMCGVHWKLEALRGNLPMPMDATHLILVQSAPLAIRFRQDEKQFDVDGAYNIRYEIVKKRIDKARIKGTSERLTQPGHIAVVYTQAREAAEYRRYIAYLASAGYLTGDVEEVELEELQGTHGLKALRMAVAEPGPSFELEIVSHGLLEARSVLAEAEGR